jgi:class 3 adenylate cyclase
MDPTRPEPTASGDPRRRRLRAVFAADVANFGGLVSVDETRTLDALWIVRRVALEELEAQGGWLFGLPGDGIFALFESAVAAVRCALNIQARLATMPKLSALRMRIGVHLGEVLFQDNQPFGESLVIAARLESLAEPGGILVSASVMEAVAPRISATFSEMGVRSLKHSPRRIATFSVTVAPNRAALDTTASQSEPLDRTVMSVPAEPAPKPAPMRAPETAPQSVPPPRAEPELAAPSAPRLPKATPLIVPKGQPDAAPKPAAAPVYNEAVQAQLSDLTRALMTHLGPVAKVVVMRHAVEIGNPGKLIRILAEEIPTEAERFEFARRAHELLERLR